MTQDEIFLLGEGNRWLARNEFVLNDKQRLALDPVIRVLDLIAMAPTDVLEIGASNGYRLQEIHSRYDCRVTAVEPSDEAIKNGQAKYPTVRFLRGTAGQLPLTEEGEFDLVIVNFVFHWVDRTRLLRSAAEIDRILKDGGYLLIGDFLPARPQRIAYHHLPGEDLWTYKQNYSEIFLASNLYQIVGAFPFDHSTQEMRSDIASSDRTQVILLRKHLRELYETVVTHR
jgi:SAM-dependent methyltransferase